MTPRTRQPRVAVCLSSGFFGFFCHAGFLAGLEQDGGITPAALGGSSAGAVAAALRATGMSHDEIRGRLRAIRTTDFLDLAGPRTWFTRGPGVVDGRRMLRLLQSLLPVDRFEDCAIPLVVSTYDINDGELRRFSEGPIAPAVVASSSVPYMFAPWRHSDGHLLWDGGIVDKTPVDAVAGLVSPVERALVHFLPSKRPRRSPWGAAGVHDALRIDVDGLRRERTEAAGVPVEWHVTRAVPLAPFRLERGFEAYEQGRATGRTAAEQILS